MKPILFTLLLLFVITDMYCQQIAPDPLFGNNGVVRMTLGHDAGLFDIGKGLAVQPDGKILVSGNFSSVKQPEVIRYHPNGTVDSSFGKNGIAAIDSITVVIYPSTTPSIHTYKPAGASIVDLTVQPDGKIVVAGNLLAGIMQPFVARLMPGGTLDSSFGIKGVFSNDYLYGFDGISAMALQKDGNILLAGGEGGEFFPFEGSILFRLTAGGSVDSSFGKNGTIQDETEPDTKEGYNNNAIAVQRDGKIVTAGYQYGGIYSCLNFVVKRYLPNGTPDFRFGNKGVVVRNDKDYEDYPETVLVQPDGKIIIGGYSAKKRHEYTLTALRYTANGKEDRAFGKKGKVTSPGMIGIVGRSGKALLQPDGKIILAGNIITEASRQAPYTLCRVDKNGKFDKSFGTGSIGIIAVLACDTSRQYASVQSAFRQPDGKIVLVGYHWCEGDDIATITRLVGK